MPVASYFRVVGRPKGVIFFSISDCGFSILRVLAHSLSTKKMPNWPRSLGRVKLTSAVPPSYFIYAGQQVLLKNAPTGNDDWKSIASQEISSSPFWTSRQCCTATAVV